MTIAHRWACCMLFPLLLSAAALGAPFGVSPLEPDPILTNLAPEECLLYVTSSGSREGDPASPNQAEQLVAEKEVQELARAVSVLE